MAPRRRGRRHDVHHLPAPDRQVRGRHARGPRRGQGRHQSRREDPDELRRHLDHGPGVHRQGERARRALGHSGHEGELPDRSREDRGLPRDHARQYRAHAHGLSRTHRGQPRHHAGRQEGRGRPAEERSPEDHLPFDSRDPRHHRRRPRPAARRRGFGAAARHQHEEPDRRDGRDLLPLSRRSLAPGAVGGGAVPADPVPALAGPGLHDAIAKDENRRPST